MKHKMELDSADVTYALTFFMKQRFNAEVESVEYNINPAYPSANPLENRLTAELRGATVTFKGELPNDPTKA